MYGLVYKAACHVESTNEMAICNDYYRDVVATLAHNMDVVTALFFFDLKRSDILYIYIYCNRLTPFLI
jgi:hypothetical protein